MGLIVHHLQTSQSERVVWLCEELGLNYTLKLHQRSPLLSPPAIKQLNPLGAAPILEDDSTNPPLILCESGAIVEYLIHKHASSDLQDQLYLPPTHPDYAPFLYWWHTSNGTIQPSISRNLALSLVKSANPDDPAISAHRNRLMNMLKHVDDRLRSVPYLAGGEFTVADIMSVWCFSTVRVFYPFGLEGCDGIQGWLKRCTQREAYKRAVERAEEGNEHWEGPYLGVEKPELFHALS